MGCCLVAPGEPGQRGVCVGVVLAWPIRTGCRRPCRQSHCQRLAQAVVLVPGVLLLLVSVLAVLVPTLLVQAVESSSRCAVASGIETQAMPQSAAPGAG